MKIFVVSMHRSGSSLVTRLINMMGAYLGSEKELMPPNDDNPRGFWERLDVVRTHNELLAELECRWDAIDPKRINNPPKEFQEKFNNDIAKVFRALPDNLPVVIKDPRICLFLDYWTAFCKNAVIVYVHRNPLSVAESLNRRNNLTLEEGFALWEFYTAQSLRSLNSTPCYFIDIDLFRSDIISQTKYLLSWLKGQGFNTLKMPAKKEINNFYNPDLLHKTKKIPQEFLTTSRLHLLDIIKDNGKTASMDKIEIDAESIKTLKKLRKDFFNNLLNKKANYVLSFSDGSSQADSIRISLIDHHKIDFELTMPEGKDVTRFELFLSSLPLVVLNNNTLAITKNDEEIPLSFIESGPDLVDGKLLIFNSRPATVITSIPNHKAVKKLSIHLKILETPANTWKYIVNNLEELIAGNGRDLKEMAELNSSLLNNGAGINSSKTGSVGESAFTDNQAIESYKLLNAQLRDWEEKYKNTLYNFRQLQIKLKEAEGRLDSQQKDLDSIKKENIILNQWKHKNKPTIDGINSKLALYLKKHSLYTKPAETVLHAIKKGEQASQLIRHLSLPQIFSENPDNPRYSIFSSMKLFITNSAKKLIKLVGLLTPKGFTAHIHKRIIRQSGLFDPLYYTLNNLDIIESGLDPLTHFLVHGGFEGRKPHPHFDPGFYLEQNPDVSILKVNPLVHFLLFGVREGRLPCEENLLNKDLSIPETGLDSNDDDETDISCWSPLNTPLRIEHQLQITNSQTIRREENIGLIISTSSQPVASIVIPVYGQIDYTIRCLYSLKKLNDGTPFEIIVVDDCSPDDSYKRLSKISGIDLRRNETNLGFVGSCNRGAASARGEYIIFLNNDTVVMDGWLDKLVSTFKNIPEAGLVGSKLLYPDGVLQEAGGIIWKDASGWNCGRGDDPDLPVYNYLRDVDYCSGASIAIPKTLWNELGGFDTQFSPGYYEDTDLAFQIRERGKRVIYQPLSELIHFEGITSGTDLRQGMKKHQVENKKKFQKKWNVQLKNNGEHNNFSRKDFDRRSKQRYLFIDSVTPTPDQDSGSNDIVDFMHMLKEDSNHVSFMPANLMYWGRYSDALQRAGIETLYAPYVGRCSAFLKDHAKKYDFIFIYRWENAESLLDTIKKHAPSTKVIFDTVDLHYLRLERQAETTKDSKLKNVAQKTREAELRAMKKADATILLSDKEKEILSREYPDLNLVHIPFSRPVPGRTAGFRQRHGIGFIGGYSHTPNVDGIIWFANEIWPAVHEKLPDAELLIAGSKMPVTVKELNNRSGIRTIGFVEDLQEFMEQCRITIAPLRFGAGIKGKVVSSLSYGVPLVGTSIASEGISDDESTHLISDTPSGFSAKVIKLYSDEKLWNRLSKNGLQMVTERFSKESVFKKLKDLLQSLN